MNTSHRLGTTALAIAACIDLLAATPARAQATVPLVTFYSPRAGDFFTTSQPAWTCALHRCPNEMGDYRVHGMQGHVFNPDRPRPAGTLALWHWFSEEREDNFLTTDPAWNPADGTTRVSGATYTFVRLAGYINPSGTNPYLKLNSFWNPATGDNAALATSRLVASGSGGPIPVRVPAGYGHYRVEGSLLPPPGSGPLTACKTGARRIGGDVTPWHARGNYIDPWLAPSDFVHGDAIRITAPADRYRIDGWGHERLVRGEGPWSLATEPAFPAAGISRFALLGLVTSGRVFVDGQGWYEANQWFRALGENFDWPGNCILYDAAGLTPGDLKLGFNDGVLSDNGGWANITIDQWW
jgi:hypothetical protein